MQRIPGRMTNREKEVCDKIYNYVKEYYIEHKYAPSIREIVIGTGFKSTSSIHGYLTIMFREGMLETDAEIGTPRAIRLPNMKIIIDDNKTEK